MVGVAVSAAVTSVPIAAVRVLAVPKSTGTVSAEMLRGAAALYALTAGSGEAQDTGRFSSLA